MVKWESLYNPSPLALDKFIVKSYILYRRRFCMAGATSRVNVSKEWMKAVGALMGPLGIGAGITAVNMWLAKSIAEGKKKPKKE